MRSGFDGNNGWRWRSACSGCLVGGIAILWTWAGSDGGGGGLGGSSGASGRRVSVIDDREARGCARFSRCRAGTGFGRDTRRTLDASVVLVGLKSAAMGG